MSYYLEGMNLIEGQSEDFSLCKGVIAPFKESGDTNAGKKCSEVYPTMGSNADGWCERTKGCIFDGDKKSNCMKAINTDENIFYLGTDDKCEEIKDEGKCGLSFRGVGEKYYRCIPNTNNDNNTFICEDPDMDGEPTCFRTGGGTIPPSIDPINTNLDDRVNKLTEQLSENFTKELMGIVEEMNEKTNYKLYDDTVINKRNGAEIKKMSFIDLGSGDGRLPILFVDKYGFKDGCGIELSNARHRMGEQNLNKCKNRNRVKLHNGNFLDDKYSFSPYDVIYISSLCFPENIVEQRWD